MTKESIAQGRIYLDLDGVIYPIARAPESDPDVDQLHAREWWRVSVTHKLGHLGVEVVLSSSWGEAFLRSKLKSPRDILRVDRVLSESDIMNESKLAAIQKDVREHPIAKVAWVDDDITDRMAWRFNEMVQESLVVTPKGNVGLTLDDMATLETFFKRDDC